MKIKSIVTCLMIITLTALAAPKVGDSGPVLGYVVQKQGEVLILSKTQNGDSYLAVKNAPAGLVAGKHFAAKGIYLGTFDWKTGTAGNTTPIPYWDVKK